LAAFFYRSGTAAILKLLPKKLSHSCLSTPRGLQLKGYMYQENDVDLDLVKYFIVVGISCQNGTWKQIRVNIRMLVPGILGTG
jgi:hypothetical protein